MTINDYIIFYISHLKLGALANYLTAGSDEPEDSVKIPQRKLQRRGRFNEMRDDGEPACGDVTEKAAEHMRRVKAT